MRKERKTLPLRLLKRNDGQLEWLRRNPRQWTKEDVERTARSIAEDSDFLEDRPLLGVPDWDGSFIVFAGNLRREGCIKAKVSEAPCVIYHPDTDADRATILRRAMKDNGSFGSWDFDTLANEWDDLPLQDWGVPAWKGQDEAKPEDYGTEFSLPDGDAPAKNQITFYFAAEQKDFILSAIDEAEECADNFGNDNKNGNKLYQIVKEWRMSKI